MRLKYAGNKRDSLVATIKNADTAVIPLGAPVVLNLSATAQGTPSGVEDGLQVVLPSTALTNSFTLAFGINISSGTSLAVNAIGEALILGYGASVLVSQTRANSTTAWAAITSGVPLWLDSTNNALVANAIAIVQSNNFPMAVLLDTIGSAASNAFSNAVAGSSGSLVITSHRVFVRFI